MTKREIMTLAWVNVKTRGLSMSEGLKAAWASNKLPNRLLTGIIKFRYIKKDGSIRDAIGTLRPDLIPPTKGTGRKPNPSVQVYFDLEKSEYRCFKKSNLIL